MAKKERITYESALDALVAVAKQLSVYEERYKVRSEDFFHRFSNGQTDDSVDFIEWANAYQNFMALRIAIEKQISHAA